MSDSFVQAPPDSAGKKIDTEVVTVGANSVHRQRIQITGVADVAVAALSNTTPTSAEYGLITRPVPMFAGSLAGQVDVSSHASLPTAAGRRFRIRSMTSNSDFVYIGGNGVTSTNGYQMDVGDQVTMEVSNLNVVFAIAASGTQRIAYLVEV